MPDFFSPWNFLTAMGYMQCALSFGSETDVADIDSHTVIVLVIVNILILIGTVTIAVISGTEKYECVKIGFGDAIREINSVIKDGYIELPKDQEVKKVPVEIFLGGDYKVGWKSNYY